MFNEMNLTPLGVLVDETWGPIDTPERDQMEAQLKEDLDAYFLDAPKLQDISDAR